jgi:hypothetical protein
MCANIPNFGPDLYGAVQIYLTPFVVIEMIRAVPYEVVEENFCAFFFVFTFVFSEDLVLIKRF